MLINLCDLDLPEKDLRAFIDEDELFELADSLRDQGQLQPIGVIEKENGRYEVVFGARRTRAARSLRWQQIKAEILEPEEANKLAAKKLIENVQRTQLTPIEEAYGLIELIGEAEANVRQLQHQTGKSRDWIKNRLALIDLPEDLQAAIQIGKIGVGVAKALGAITDDETRQYYLTMCLENGSTAEQAEGMARMAEFAQTGIMAMREGDTDENGVAQMPQIIEQKLNCFSCGDQHSFREVNTLVLCGGCQHQIATKRVASAER
jgi:ParB family chromosome partitioning protein